MLQDRERNANQTGHKKIITDMFHNLYPIDEVSGKMKAWPAYKIFELKTRQTLL